MNYSNRYTSLVGKPLTVQDNNQQLSQSSKISKEIEESLRNYFGHLKNQNPISEIKSRDISPSKKYSTINPSNFNNQISAVPTVNLTNQATTNNDLKHSKFATVNPNDLKKRIAEAFHSIKTKKEEDIFKLRANGPHHPSNTTNMTEEIEKAANFSQSSNESITKFAESLRSNRVSTLYETSSNRQPETTSIKTGVNSNL